jgi:hypothetical protein
MSTTGLPRHETRSAVLSAKSDLLDIAAKQYAAGACTFDDLKVAAVDFTEALVAKAGENVRGMR